MFSDRLEEHKKEDSESLTPHAIVLRVDPTALGVQTEYLNGFQVLGFPIPEGQVVIRILGAHKHIQATGMQGECTGRLEMYDTYYQTTRAAAGICPTHPVSLPPKSQFPTARTLIVP
jgi:hypothetical protein